MVFLMFHLGLLKGKSLRDHMDSFCSGISGLKSQLQVSMCNVYQDAGDLLSD